MHALVSDFIDRGRSAQEAVDRLAGGARTPGPVIPRPSAGRIVLWCERAAPGSPVEWPAIVLQVDPDDARFVQLRVFGRQDEIVYSRHTATPDRPTTGNWRYPPRVVDWIKL